MMGPHVYSAPPANVQAMLKINFDKGKPLSQYEVSPTIFLQRKSGTESMVQANNADIWPL